MCGDGSCLQVPWQTHHREPLLVYHFPPHGQEGPVATALPENTPLEEETAVALLHRKRSGNLHITLVCHCSAADKKALSAHVV